MHLVGLYTYCRMMYGLYSFKSIHVLLSSKTNFYQLRYCILLVFRNVQRRVTELIKGFFAGGRLTSIHVPVLMELGSLIQIFVSAAKRYLSVTNHFLISGVVTNFRFLDLTVAFLSI